jgi:hypothetical protein
MDDATVVPVVWQKGLFYRPTTLTNVYFNPAYGMYDYVSIGVNKESCPEQNRKGEGAGGRCRGGPRHRPPQPAEWSPTSSGGSSRPCCCS